jgi:hypothetical protein
MLRKCALASLLTFSSIMLVARPAHAGMSKEVGAFVELVAIVVGIGTLAVAITLGVLSWRTARKPPTSSGGVFARSFLGISAALAFGVAGYCFSFGFSDALEGVNGLLRGMVDVLVLAFVGLELFVTARLYADLHTRAPSMPARLLKIGSFAGAGVFLVAAAVSLVGALREHFYPNKVDYSAAIERYRAGCDAGDGSDCNMLGMTLRNTDDTAGAVEALERGCELGTPLACGNLAAQYSLGEGVPSSSARANELRRRQRELEAAAPPGAASAR